MDATTNKPTAEHQRERIAEFRKHIDNIIKGANERRLNNPKSKSFNRFAIDYMYGFLSNNEQKLTSDPVYFIVCLRGDVIGEFESAIKTIEGGLTDEK